MTTRKRLHSASIVLLASWLLGACSAPTPEPKAEPETTATPPAHTAEPEPTASAEAPVPSASAEGPSTPKPSGRPGVSFSNAEKITNTFGASPSAKLELGTEGASMRIPEFALSEGGGILITFMIDKKAKKAKSGAGTIYRLQGQIPPAESFSTITTKGPTFVLRLPTAKIASPNLAIGETATDAKGKETLTWKIIAPAKTEEGFATFELSTFTNAILQITSDAPN